MRKARQDKRFHGLAKYFRGYWTKKPDMNTEHIEIALAAIQIYGASHPRPSEVTQEQACELLGRSAPYALPYFPPFTFSQDRPST